MAKQSLLLALHKANDAVLASFDGWLLPSTFGDPASEYRSVRSGVGLLDLSNRAVLQISGPDRLSYLQGMLSNDLRPLVDGQGLYAAFLTQQGKVLGDCRVLCTENAFILDLWEPIKDKIIQHLNRYLVADEVEISDRLDGRGIFSLQGPRSGTLLATVVGGERLPEDPMSHSMTSIEGVAARIIRQSHTGEDGFDVIVSSSEMEKVARSIAAAGDEYSVQWVGEEAAEVLRIEAGIPRYNLDFTEEHLILETGLEHAVSYQKGCYLGQEVVERIRSRGHVNKRLSGLILDGEKPAAFGSRIVSDERDVGSTTSSVYSPALERAIALGYIHRDHRAAGTRLTLRHHGAVIGATVTELPFVKASVRTGTL